jgi:phosphoribosylformylglycinamidine cyclo-ligase
VGEPGAPLTYARAGVDIEGASRLVGVIGELARGTQGPEVAEGVGGFAGLYSLGGSEGEQLLAATSDGVGTKAMVCTAAGRYDTIGIDLVAMCVDDLVCTGARPLFLLDYVAVGRLDTEVVAELVAGVAEGCRRAGCALLGGETAEHPGALAPGDFDLAGFAVGLVGRSRALGPRRVRAGDRLVGLPSPGLRANGYSLARKALLEVAGRSLDGPAWPGAVRSLAEVLLEPSVIYSPTVLALAERVELHAAAHVTGGGLVANLARVMPAGLRADVDWSAWEPPEVFAEVARAGRVRPDEMRRVFNMGVGMVLVVAASDAPRALGELESLGMAGVEVGEVVATAG